MATLEERIQHLEDRQALQDVLTAFCTAVDSLSDVDGLLNCFTEDAVMDMTGIGLPRFVGREDIRGFFQQVFTDMTHHAHCSTNFAVDSLEGDTATCRANVIGTGVSRDGHSILVYVRYFLDFVRTAAGWKMKNFSEATMLPLPKELTDTHGRS